MNRHPIRAYVETSVFGGMFDAEFKTASTAFFGLAAKGVFRLVISEATQIEIARAPANVQGLFGRISKVAEIAPLSTAIVQLQQAYLKAGIVSEKWAIDCLHVAVASASGCGLIVSWNFKHIVNYRKVPLYNAVNVINGYQTISIVSPLEVVEANEEKEI